jgi:hypothetical protein
MGVTRRGGGRDMFLPAPKLNLGAEEGGSSLSMVNICAVERAKFEDEDD